ncbi:MAG: response regulator [Actinobacteria bacterium]|nr:response regulator [Actinomycetota bacterium]
MARTVLLVDDHPGFRAQARILLASVGFQVVAEADDASAALAAERVFRPEVVLLDIQLPDGNGFDVARAILDGRDPPAVILISSREAADYGTRIGRSGVRGFISKAELSGSAIEALLGGDP